MLPVGRPADIPRHRDTRLRALLHEAHLGIAYRPATAAVERIDISDNPRIAFPSTVFIEPTATSNCKAKKGVFATTSDGRIGWIKADPDHNQRIKLIWIDDGSESLLTKVDTLTVIVDSTSPSVVQKFDHIQALGSINVKSLSVRKCNLGPQAIRALSSTLSTAGLVEVDLSENPVTGGDQVKTNLKSSRATVTQLGCTMDGISNLSSCLANIKSLDISICGIGIDALKILADGLLRSTVDAKRVVNASNNPCDPTQIEALGLDTRVITSGCDVWPEGIERDVWEEESDEDSSKKKSKSRI